MDGGVGGRAAFDRYCDQRSGGSSDRLMRVHGDRHAAAQSDILDAWLISKRKLDIDRGSGWAVCEHLGCDTTAYPEPKCVDAWRKYRETWWRVFAQLWDVRNGLLLVDEPLAAFDPRLQLELFEQLTIFSRVRNHALVAVLHDVQLALQGFERLLMIKHGKLFADCPASIAAMPQLERLFGVRFLTHQVDGVLFLHTAGLVGYP